jgi:hypothetical protein
LPFFDQVVSVRSVLGVLLLCLGVAAFAQNASSNRLALVDWTVPVPKTWNPQSPSSSMRLAQFSVPGKAGAGEVAIFYFGPGGGGPVQANIDRWASQFTTPQGGAVKPVVTKGTAAGMSVTHVELNGSYSRGVGMGQEGKPMPNQSLRVAVIETPKGNITFQIWGPRDTVTANWRAFKTMVDGIQQKK